MQNNYRAEIDGLRALAIIPVIFFHTGNSIFEGGYVGVDIFFVISGYLITRLIKNEFLDNKFSLKSFYERRIRRIIPALFFMVLVITIISTLIMVPADLIDFYKSSLANSLFLSNFFFWTNTNYFSNPAELIPLIHTWSISIEEQFYLFFPILFIFLMRKYSLTKVSNYLILFLILSICFAQFVGNFNLNYPYINNFSFFYISSASFYVPFSRAWELLLGALLAIYLNKNNNIKSKFPDIYILIGILMIMISLIFYNKNIPYASIYTLLPVIGTSLIILFLNKNSYFYFYFTNKIIIFLGLISYSLYLWHQPIFALYRIFFINEPKFYEYLFLISLSILIAYISWKYIEKPFRKKNFLSQNKVFILFAATSLIIICVNLIGIQTKGFNKIKIVENKLGSKKTINIDRPLKTKEIIELQSKFLRENKDKFLLRNKKTKILLIGDSHARDLYIAFKLNEEKYFNYDFYKLTLGNNCITFLERKKHIRNKVCENQKDSIISNEEFLNIADYIIISMRYYGPSSSKLDSLIKKLNLDKNKIILFGARSEFYRPVSLALNLTLRNKDKNFSERKLFNNRKKHTDDFNAELLTYSKNKNLLFYDPSELACNYLENKCDFFSDSFELFYYDAAHWTVEGAKHFGGKISREFDFLISN